MSDAFEKVEPGLQSPAGNADVITPSDADDLPNVPRAIYIGTAGNVKVQMVSGHTVTLSNVQAGVIYPIRVRKVFATDTTADALVALW